MSRKATHASDNLRTTREIFVGRDVEIERMKTALDDAESGRGRIVMLVGEPGIGKTATIHKFVKEIVQRDVEVLRGRCFEGIGAPHYWPWIEILRENLELNEGARAFTSTNPYAAAAIAEIDPRVGSYLGKLPELEHKEDPFSARFRFLDAYTAYMKSAAGDRPLILILEDLHWADNSSLVLLEFLSHYIRKERILVFGAYRDVELTATHPLRQTLGELNREEFFERIPLRGLSRDDIELFVTGLFAASKIKTIATEIYGRTEGNPLFMHEMVRMVIDKGTDVSSSGVPDGVRDVIGRRLVSLSESCNKALRVASVIGQEFDADVLLALLAPLPAREILEALEEAEVAKLIEGSPNEPGRRRFKHELIKEVLLAEVTSTRRAELNARIVETLEELYGDEADDHAIELVERCTAATPKVSTEKLLHYLITSAERSLETYAWASALEYFDRVFKLMGESCDAISARLYSGRAMAQFAMCLYSDSNASYKRAYENYEELGDIRGMVSVVTAPIRVFGEETICREDEWLERACGAVLELVPEDSREYGSVRAYLSYRAFGRTGDYETAEAELRAVIDSAVSRSDSTTEMRALVYLSQITLASHQYRKSIEFMQRALSLSRDLGEISAQLQMLLYLSYNYRRTGDRRERTYLDEFRLLADKVGGVHHKLLANAHSAHFAMAWADLDNALRYQRKVMAVSRKTYAYEWFVLADIELARGNMAEHVRCMQNACDLLKSQKKGPVYIYQLARTSYLTGDERWLDLAERLTAEAIANHGKSEQELLFVAAARAWLIIARGDRTAAQAFREEARLSSGPGWPVLALLVRTKGDTETAIRYFRERIEDCRRLEYRWGEYWASYWLAETLLDRGDPGDDETARKIIYEVISDTEKVGMAFLREKAEQLSQRLPGADMVIPDGLTRREVDVLKLVAEGLTNKSIGEELYISAKTVSTHMKHIFSKIGASNRTEASAYAAKNRIVQH